MQTVTSPHDPDEIYRNYHGAPVVSLIFRLVDWYLRARQRHAAGHIERLLSTSWQAKIRLSSGSRGQPS